MNDMIETELSCTCPINKHITLTTDNNSQLEAIKMYLTTHLI